MIKYNITIILSFRIHPHMQGYMLVKIKIIFKRGWICVKKKKRAIFYLIIKAITGKKMDALMRNSFHVVESVASCPCK